MPLPQPKDTLKPLDPDSLVPHQVQCKRWDVNYVGPEGWSFRHPKPDLPPVSTPLPYLLGGILNCEGAYSGTLDNIITRFLLSTCDRRKPDLSFRFNRSDKELSFPELFS